MYYTFFSLVMYYFRYLLIVILNQCGTEFIGSSFGFLRFKAKENRDTGCDLMWLQYCSASVSHHGFLLLFLIAQYMAFLLLIISCFYLIWQNEQILDSFIVKQTVKLSRTDGFVNSLYSSFSLVRVFKKNHDVSVVVFTL